MSNEQLNTLKATAVRLVDMITELQETLKDENGSSDTRSVLSVAFPAPVPVSVTDTSPRISRRQQADESSVRAGVGASVDGADTEEVLDAPRRRAPTSRRPAMGSTADSASTVSTTAQHADAKSTVSVSYDQASDTVSNWTDTASRSSRIRRNA